MLYSDHVCMYVRMYVNMSVYVGILRFSVIYYYGRAKHNARRINLPAENVHIDQPGPAADGFTFNSLTWALSE